MSLSFLYHLLIVGIIYYVITTWFKFFLKLRLTVDFSYISIIICASYISALLNMHYGRWIVWTIIASWIWCIALTIIILFLSNRLSRIYFIVGTLALYIFFIQITTNRESVTNGTFWLSGMSRILRGNIHIVGMEAYLWLSLVVGAIVFLWLFLFKKTYLFTILKWRGEKGTILKVLWIRVPLYTFIMILITSLCAVIGANLYTFYYLYIDPISFRLSMLVLVLVIWFISYKGWEFSTLITALIVIFAYEYLRFFKVVDPSMLGYVRESLFALIIMITSFITFRRTAFGREQ